ncbi:MAG: TetR/AcrR family transcriptional regulator [Pseudomonadota bacterium]
MPAFSDSKAQATRAAIIDHALQVASHDGLESLTMGTLADALKMSKSGVFNRVGSRETLQLAVLERYRRRFEAQVLRPAQDASAGLARLRRLFKMSLEQVGSSQAGGCFYLSCAAEYDDRLGAVRQELTGGVLAWRAAFSSCVDQARQAGQLAADTDGEQFVFETYALLLAVQHDTRLLDRAGSINRALAAFEKLVVQRAVGAPSMASTSASVGA